MNEQNTYWKENISLIIKCLVIWFVVSYGFGIILVDSLNTIHLGGYKLGFWFAQQGSIIGFVFIILIYALYMNRVDRWYNEELESLQKRKNSD